MIAGLAEESFYDLDAAPRRVCAAEVPIPYAKHLEDAALPSTAAIVETVFGWPGMAAVLVDSAAALDFPLLAALTVGAALAVLAGSALSDAAAVAIDPRVRIAA